MRIIERSPGQEVRIGPYTVRVLEVQRDRVVVALLDPDKDCAFCGGGPADRHRCPVCRAEVVICPGCVPSHLCPRCSSPWEDG